jgi:signal peptidase I
MNPKKTKHLIQFLGLSLIILIIVLLIKAIWWLVIFALITFFFYLIFTSDHYYSNWIKSRMSLVILCMIIGFFSLSMFFSLAFGIYTISGSSMKYTLINGDRVLVSKMAFGPRLYETLCNLPGSQFFTILTKRKIRFDKDVWKTRRLKGIGHINRGDI